MLTREFYLDERSPVPVYAQLRDQILHALARGSLRQGQRLPSVRDFATTLGINPNTVNRAYAELERSGVIETQRGRGTYIAGNAQADRTPHLHKLTELVERFIVQARALGFDRDHIARAVTAHLRKLQ